jgi:hypothetical protein
MNYIFYFIVFFLFSASSVFGLTLQEKMEIVKQKEVQRKQQAAQRYSDSSVREQKRVEKPAPRNKEVADKANQPAETVSVSAASQQQAKKVEKIESDKKQDAASGQGTVNRLEVGQLWEGVSVCGSQRVTNKLYISSISDNYVEAVAFRKHGIYGSEAYIVEGKTNENSFDLKFNGKKITPIHRNLPAMGFFGSIKSGVLSANLEKNKCSQVVGNLAVGADVDNFKKMIEKYYAEIEAEKLKQIAIEKERRERQAEKQRLQQQRENEVEAARVEAAPIGGLELSTATRSELSAALQEKVGKSKGTNDSTNRVIYEASFLPGMDQVQVLYTDDDKVAVVIYGTFTAPEMNNIVTALGRKYKETYQDPARKSLQTWRCKNSVYIDWFVDSSDPAGSLGKMMMAPDNAEVYYLQFTTEHYRQYRQEQKNKKAEKLRKKTDKMMEGL